MMVPLIVTRVLIDYIPVEPNDTYHICSNRSQGLYLFKEQPTPGVYTAPAFFFRTALIVLMRELMQGSS